MCNVSASTFSNVRDLALDKGENNILGDDLQKWLSPLAAENNRYLDKLETKKERAERGLDKDGNPPPPKTVWQLYGYNDPKAPDLDGLRTTARTAAKSAAAAGQATFYSGIAGVGGGLTLGKNSLLGG